MINRREFTKAAAACVGVAVSGPAVLIFVTASLLSGLLPPPSYAVADAPAPDDAPNDAPKDAPGA